MPSQTDAAIREVITWFQQNRDEIDRMPPSSALELEVINQEPAPSYKPLVRGVFKTKLKPHRARRRNG